MAFDSNDTSASQSATGSTLAGATPTIETVLDLYRKLIELHEIIQRNGISIASGSASRNHLEVKPHLPNGTPALAASHLDRLQGQSLRLQFPSIPTPLLLDIIRHSLHPRDVMKLVVPQHPTLSTESLNRVKVDSELAATPSLWAKSLLDLIPPLNVYFQVLQSFAALAPEPDSSLLYVARGAATYLNHLIDLNSRYPWQAVLLYHESFHDRRLTEMSEGVYDGWLTVEPWKGTQVGSETDLSLKIENSG